MAYLRNRDKWNRLEVEKGPLHAHLIHLDEMYPVHVASNASKILLIIIRN